MLSFLAWCSPSGFDCSHPQLFPVCGSLCIVCYLICKTCSAGIRWQTWQSKNITFLCIGKLVDWIFWRKRIQNHESLAVCFGSLFAVWSGLSLSRENSSVHIRSHWQPHIQTKSPVTNRWCSILRMWVFLSYFIFFSSSFWFTLVSSVQRLFPELSRFFYMFSLESVICP